MWVLEKDGTPPDEIHFLYCGTLLLVTRREGHILLQGDVSISRQHAAIFITHSIENLKNIQVLPKVELTDLGAKYGTYMNEGIESQQKLLLNSKTELNNGDQLKFGMLTNLWRLVYRPLIVTTSTLQLASRDVLTDALLKLGGHLVDEWSNACLYLVMTNITFTVKVVCALAAGRYIVTPEFFTKLLDAVINKTSHPNPAEYNPPLKEMTINSGKVSFVPDERRKTLFSGCTFLFSSEKQLKRMAQAIALAGGSAEKLNEENYKMLVSNNYLLVKIRAEKSSSSKNDLYNTAEQLLSDNRLRAIPESDIGLAILYMDTSGHCNPAFKVSSILRPGGSSASEITEGLQIYATETQDTEENPVSWTGTRVVPETGQSSASRRPSCTAATSNCSPVSSNTSTSTSTNVTFLPTLGQSLPSLTGIEDKENFLNSTKKRSRPVNGEDTAPSSKRISIHYPDQIHQDHPDPTQPMESQIDCNDSQSNSQVTALKFEPQHCSTQKNKTTTPATSSSDGHPSEANKTSRIAPTDMPSTSGESLDKSIGCTGVRSIPFEPYTLPSLKTDTLYHDDMSTQQFVPVKDEPLTAEADESLLDVTDCHPEKRRAEEQMNLLNKNDDSLWHGGKKRKIGNENNGLTKTERSLINNNQRTNTFVHSVKQEQAEEDNLFDLPTTSERVQRRRAGSQSAAAANSTTVNVREHIPDDELFALPTSSRSERRRRQLDQKAEDTRAPQEGNRSEPAKATQAPINNPCRGSVEQKQKIVIVSNEGDFISKKSISIKRSPSELEAAAQTGMPLPGVIKHGDVAELSGAMEKSLVVVEVASLVRRNNRISAETSLNQNFGGLQNYKRFRKNINEITSLPRIIGGRDLVAHDVAENPLRDAWFSQHQDVTIVLEERTTRNAIGSNFADDELFDLPGISRNRSRVRK
ncbi:hypothetical protein OTU49_002202 [Cherax quadricarinatus]|uniref:Nibrin n=1 Tax=Cherax quadricarinatus TaxID=27406 RepID=A0AAW0XAJ8_CHEQU|nr:nibrin-like isoform X1 [Cherax quadricarinatus]